MSDSTMSSLPVGKYSRGPSTSSRSPCPVINALANHGHLPRSGQHIYLAQLNASLRHVGMSHLLGSVFAVPTYFEYHNPSKAYLREPVPKWQRVWAVITNPYKVFDYFGCWRMSQVDEEGNKFLNLEDLASHGAIEHDISLSRRDIGQKEGNNDPQQDLIDEMLAYANGQEIMTIDDLGEFIKARIQRQLHDNPDLVYGPDQHQVNCGQVALMMGCFGDGKTIKTKYVKALFSDERLPYEEGWTKRSWWNTMGLVEFFGAVRNLVKVIGVKF